MASQKSVETRLGQIQERMHDLDAERAHLLSIYKSNRRETIRKTGQLPPLGSFLGPQERTAIEMNESIALSNAEIDRKAALIRPLA